MFIIVCLVCEYKFAFANRIRFLQLYANINSYASIKSERNLLMERITEEMKLWLFDLAHGNLDDSQILPGFVRYYLLYDLSIHDVVNDIVYRTTYGVSGVQTAKSSLLRVLHAIADNRKEVEQI